MKCPNCSHAVHIEFEWTEVYQDKDYDSNGLGCRVLYGECPQCGQFIVCHSEGKFRSSKDGRFLEGETSDEIIYPKNSAKPVEPEVPDRYRRDFLEAHAVLSVSPKASAALSRRILQDVLREHYKINHPNLAQEIDAFMKLKDIPSYLRDAVDAVRNVGNFAAHPLKSTQTGSVVDVEPGEAEWLIEVIESLFDVAFVQPMRLVDRKNSLNQKLQSMGKLPMK